MGRQMATATTHTPDASRAALAAGIQLSATEKAYFAELAADIARHHGADASAALQRDPVATLTAAHERRQAFAAEMLEQRTERSKMARIVLCAEVYATAGAIAARHSALEQCENLADRNYRAAFGPFHGVEG